MQHPVLFHAEPDTAELLSRTAHATRQLCIYGAVAHWSNSQQVQATELSAESNLSWFSVTLFHTKHENMGHFGGEGIRRKDSMKGLQNLLDAARLATVCEGCWVCEGSLDRTVLHDRA